MLIIKNNFRYLVKKLDISFLVLLIIAIISGIGVYKLKGEQIFYDALRNDFFLFFNLLPLIIAGILLGGFVQVLVPSKLVAKLLGRESGFKGIVIASLIGAITPGGPIISFPLVLALRSAGADIGALMAFLTAWSTVAINRTLIWEVPFMGPEFSFIRLLSSLILPLIVGVVARKIYELDSIDKDN